MNMQLFTPAEKKIIELLLTGDKTLPEISTMLKISKPGTSKHLKKLGEHHIIKGTYEQNTQGRTIRYHLQPFHLVFSLDPHLQITINCTAEDTLNTDFFMLGYIPQKEFRDDVKEYLNAVNNTTMRDYTIVLYGSVAQGSGNRKSDIDLLILRKTWTKKEKDEMIQILADASMKTTHQAKPLFMNHLDFKTMDPSLKKEIRENGIILFEKGSSWTQLKQEMKKYKSIMI